MALDLNKRYQFRTPEGYFDGPEPGDGNLIDVWLNTDTHAWVNRVNTQRILNHIKDLKRQREEDRKANEIFAQAINNLANALRN